MEQSKPWYKSKTFYFNIALFLLDVAQHLAGQRVISTETEAQVAVAGNLALRAVTKRPITLK